MRKHPLAKLDQRYLWHPFTQMRDWLKGEPLVIERGDGARRGDADGAVAVALREQPGQRAQVHVRDVAHVHVLEHGAAVAQPRHLPINDPVRRSTLRAQ